MTPDERLRAELEELELAAPSDLPPRPSSGQRSTAWRPVLTLFATVTLAVAVVAVVALGLLDDARPTSSAPASVSARPSATPAPPRPSVALAWHVVPFDEPGAILISIAEVDGRLIMTGSLDGLPQAWFSDDAGGTWQRSIREGLDRQAPGALGAVAGTPDRLVSIGTRSIGANDAEVAAAVWVSDDVGAQWRPISADATPSGVTDVVWNGESFVAFGGGTAASAVDYVSTTVAVWTSDDGEDWRQVSGPEPFGQPAALMSVAASGGQLALSIANESGDRELWFSEDGADWALDPSGLRIRPEAISADRGGFTVITMFDEPGEAQPLLMHTADGSSWTAHPLELALPPGITAASPLSVTPGPLGSVITGYTGQVRGGAGSLTWFLPVGSGLAELIDVGMAPSAAALSDRFVAIGRCGPLADCATTLVMGLPEDTAPPATTIQDAPP